MGRHTGRKAARFIAEVQVIARQMEADAAVGPAAGVIGQRVYTERPAPYRRPRGVVPTVPVRLHNGRGFTVVERATSPMARGGKR